MIDSVVNRSKYEIVESVVVDLVSLASIICVVVVDSA